MSASQLRVVIGTTVCGQNMAIIRTAATAMDTQRLDQQVATLADPGGLIGVGVEESALSGVSGRTSYPAASTAATISGSAHERRDRR